LADIFLSYSREDSERAKSLAEIIERRTGRTIWWDRSAGDSTGIVPGDDFDKLLRRAIDDAPDFVVLLSPHSLRSKWVRAELHRAIATERRVIPVQIGPVDLKDVPLRLSPHDIVDLRDLATAPDELERLIRVWKRGTDAPSPGRLEMARRVLPLTVPFVLLAFLGAATGFFDLLGIDTRLSFVTLSARELTGARRIDPRLVLVSIDDETDRRVGPRTDVSRWRAAHARALDRLTKAKVIAYDITFEANDVAKDGTAQLAAAIRRARANGTSVVVGTKRREGDPLAADPEIRSALFDPLSLGKGRGALGHVCLGERAGLVSTVPLIASRPKSEPIISLALAAFNPRASVVVRADSNDRIGLNENGTDTPLLIAGYEPAVDSALDCGALNGTTPARYYLDVFPYDVARSSPGVIPFEAISEDPAFDSKRVSDKIVLVGSWRAGEDVQKVWDRGPTQTSGMKIQAAALNTLLSETFIRRIGPLSEVVWLGALALAAALIRARTFPTQGRLRAGLLALLVVADLTLAVVLSLAGLLSDLPYHFAIIGLSYAYLGKSSWAWLRIARTFSGRPANSTAPQELG
jgi:CHASE2 domain-containing sensor protein